MVCGCSGEGAAAATSCAERAGPAGLPASLLADDAAAKGRVPSRARGCCLQMARVRAASDAVGEALSPAPAAPCAPPAPGSAPARGREQGRARRAARTGWLCWSSSPVPVPKAGWGRVRWQLAGVPWVCSALASSLAAPRDAPPRLPVVPFCPREKEKASLQNPDLDFA